MPRAIQVNIEPLPILEEEVEILSIKCKYMVSFVNDTHLGLLDDHLIIIYGMIRDMHDRISHEIQRGPKIENIRKINDEYTRLEYWLLEKRNLSSS
jgi:hypothetical protein